MVEEDLKKNEELKFNPSIHCFGRTARKILGKIFCRTKSLLQPLGTLADYNLTAFFFPAQFIKCKCLTYILYYSSITSLHINS